MAIQRLLKAAGTFGFQAAKKGKQQYATHFPAALTRSIEIMSAYPEFAGFREKLKKYLRRTGRSLNRRAAG